MLKSRLPEIAAVLGAEVQAALETGAETVAAAARGRTPVQTGRLRDSIQVEREPEGVAVKAGSQKVFYGRLVEFGTVNNPPHPFLVPALEESREAIEVEAIAAIRRAAGQ